MQVNFLEHKVDIVSVVVCLVSFVCLGGGFKSQSTILAHLSQRLIGELIVYRWSLRACVRPSVNAFKHENLYNQLAGWVGEWLQ